MAVEGGDSPIPESLREIVRTVPADTRYRGPILISVFGFLAIVGISFAIAGITVGDWGFFFFGLLLMAACCVGVSDSIRHSLPGFNSSSRPIRVLSWIGLAGAALASTSLSHPK